MGTQSSSAGARGSTGQGPIESALLAPYCLAISRFNAIERVGLILMQSILITHGVSKQRSLSDCQVLLHLAL